MSVNQQKVSGFIESLRGAETPNDNLVNIYDDVHDPLGWRRSRLRRWLTLPRDRGPLVLFLGEAPGRDGAAVTGVPFASVETLTAVGFERLHAVQDGEGFAAVCGGEPKRTERTAKIFWDVALREFKCLPLPITWNIVPFWPTDNKTPNAEESMMGLRWTRQVVTLFPEAHVVGIGTIARDRLRKSGDLYDWAYHPSRRKSQFAAKLIEIASTLRDSARQ